MFNATEQADLMLTSATSDMQYLTEKMIESLQSATSRIENCAKDLETATSPQSQAQIYQYILSAYQRTCSTELVEDMGRLINKVHAICEMKMLYEIEARAKAVTAE